MRRDGMCRKRRFDNEHPSKEKYDVRSDQETRNGVAAPIVGKEHSSTRTMSQACGRQVRTVKYAPKKPS